MIKDKCPKCGSEHTHTAYAWYKCEKCKFNWQGNLSNGEKMHDNLQFILEDLGRHYKEEQIIEAFNNIIYSEPTKSFIEKDISKFSNYEFFKSFRKVIEHRIKFEEVIKNLIVRVD